MAREGWDHSNRAEFVDYYTRQSQTERSRERFAALQRLALRVLHPRGPMDVADLGCGAGTQTLLWAAVGHRVHGLDISADLIEVATSRAREAGYHVDLRVGSVTDLPWPDQSMDVCLLIELLEHVTDWNACLDECVRVLRVGGLLLLTTTNRLCPVQSEFTLPLYSWYPGPLKRYYERLARTTRAELANYATYPAMHWFTFYGLRRRLAPYGFRSLDRFDVMDLEDKNRAQRLMVSTIRSLPPLRWVAHVTTPYTLVAAIKQAGE